MKALVCLLVLAMTLILVPSNRMSAQASSAQPEARFKKDVASIRQRSCQNCHRPGSIGPMSLLSYEEARPWAKAIRENVVSRNMPPWHIDPNVGITHFKNSIALSDQEIATIAKWVEIGSP